MEEFICPRCKQLFRGFPALGRRDNVKICSQCATIEAFRDYFEAEARKTEEEKQ